MIWSAFLPLLCLALVGAMVLVAKSIGLLVEWRRGLTSPSAHIAELVIGLLESDEGWSEDLFHLKHEATKVSIWIANKDYGLGVQVGGVEARPGNSIDLCPYWRKQIWERVEARQARETARHLQESTVRLASNIIDFHERKSKRA